MIESIGRALPSPGSRASLALGSATLLLAGCGDTGNDTAGADSTTIPAAPASAFPTTKAAGAPVRIGLITNEGGPTTSQPETREAAEAAVKYANAELGGIAGRPIRLTVCKTKEEPTTARDCANQMVEAKVDAVVLTSSGLGDSMVPIVTKAGIPWATSIAAGNSEGTTANAFSWTGGFPTTMTSMAAYAKEKGYKKVAVFVIDAPAAVSGIEAIGKPVFARAGVGLRIVTTAAGTPDASPQVSAALRDKPVAVVGESTVCTSVLQAMSTLGAGIARISVQSCVAPEVVQAVGAGMNGLQVFSSFDVASNDIEARLYRQVTKRYSTNTPTQGYAAIGYQGVLGLARALHGPTGTVSAKEVTGTVSSDGKLGQPRVVDPSSLFAR
ncbi:ABC transporter substrate-binding protein [Streptomyces sp. NPDC002276]